MTDDNYSGVHPHMSVWNARNFALTAPKAYRYGLNICFYIPETVKLSDMTWVDIGRIRSKGFNSGWTEHSAALLLEVIVWQQKYSPTLFWDGKGADGFIEMMRFKAR